MATVNPFDLLGDDDNDDPSHLIAVHQQKIAAKMLAAASAPQAPAKLPAKPLPPAQAVREEKSSASTSRGGGRGGQWRGRGGRGGGPGQNRDFGNGNVDGFSGSYGGGGGGQDGDTSKPLDRERGSNGGARQSYGGYRRGGYGSVEAGGDNERTPKRMFEHRSGTGRGNEFKREGAGRGNWGTSVDDVIAQESMEVVNIEDKNFSPEKQPDQENTAPSETNKEVAMNEIEEKEQEDKEMTLEEFEKVREEKRKALLSLKTKERKVDVDKELQSMQQLSVKKENDDIFIKLRPQKDSRKQKDSADRDEKVKKSVSINEFLKPAEGQRYYGPGSHGRGRGRGERAPSRGSFGRGGDFDSTKAEAAVKIEDPGQFPMLGGK